LAARAAAKRGDLLVGTVDTWLLWNLTGGPNGGVHVTDVTNASRTLLMDLDNRTWDADIAAEVGVPLAVLPEIRSSSEEYGRGAPDGPLPGVPVAAILGDQQAAMFGQTCFATGEAKNTYGTGSFVLVNTGTNLIRSSHGLVSTVCYQIGGNPAVYALEGSIAVTGSLVQWLRDNLGVIASAAEVESLAGSVDDNGGAYIVPAFSGLFAPYWRADARGTIVGMTRYTTKAHLARAALEAAAYQTCDVLAAMQADSGAPMTELRVDGGMAVNNLLMQIQADLLGIPVVRPRLIETTALGAAYAAGLAVGFWPDTQTLRTHWQEDRRFEPQKDGPWRDDQLRWWRKAVDRSLNWAETSPQAKETTA
jgi:glycerol kinase